jgi:anti-sigma factor RsiW
MSSDCDNLDAYLDDDLSGDEAARFLVHLDQCEECREAIEQQGWIDGLLHAPERMQLESPPAALALSIRSSLNIRHRNSRLLACSLAAAAALIVAAGWTLLLNRQADRGARIEVATKARTASDEAVVSKHGESTVVGGPDLIVVPVASRHPDVTVVQVFQIYQPYLSNSVSAEPKPAADDFVWPDDFNGG